MYKRSLFKFFSTVSNKNPAFNITNNCIKRIKLLQKKHGHDIRLRVSVDAGGCSGFQYHYDIEKPPFEKDPDQIDYLYKQENTQIIIDDISMNLIKGSTIDYQGDLIRSAFIIIDNPNATEDCGCGVSFNSNLF